MLRKEQIYWNDDDIRGLKLKPNFMPSQVNSLGLVQDDAENEIGLS